ncbi:hypothetical protein MTO96_041041, partial [Rhipicephalus appendiculatus]
MSEGNRCHRGWIKTEVQHKSFTFGAPAAEGGGVFCFKTY